MTNSKENHLGQTPPLKNRRGQKLSARRLGDYVGSLPLQQQLSASQRVLIKLSASWNSWLRNNLDERLVSSAVLSHFADGQLLISCDNATIASQIKHLQTSLIDYLNETGFQEIQSVSVRIENLNIDNTLIKSADTIKHATPYCQPSSNSIKSISHCQQTVNSESLSAALQRLEKTLKDN